MAFNGGGVFVRLYSWVTDAASGIKIRADRMDNEMNGMATGLSTCVTRDGQSPATANLPMGGFKHSNAAAGAAAGEYLTYGQSINGVTTSFKGPVSNLGTDTGIGVNYPTGGSSNMAMCYVAYQNNVGNAVGVAIYMLRFGYSGDNVTATLVSVDPGATTIANPLSFSVSVGHTLIVTAFSPGLGNLVTIQQFTG